jgi:type VI secretion system secreted protein Hcp
MFDAYLKIDGIPGESTADGYKDQIEILSYSHGVSQPAAASASSAGGASVGRCEHQDFTIVKELDKASPLLAQHCCNGKHIPLIVLTLVRAGGDKPVAFMEYKLTNNIVSSIAPSGSKDGFPLESVSFNYGKIEWTYIQQKRADGAGGGKTTGSWNLETNAAK